MIDTHCHLTFPEFVGRVPETLRDAAAAGVDGVISISTTVPDAERVLAIAKSHERVWCTAGVHPLYADQGPHDWERLGRAIRDEKCVGWGELGLDNHYDRPDGALQRRVLEEQLAFIVRARDEGVDKPIVLHCREAFRDLIPVLRGAGIPGDRFVFHCFTGTPADMRLLLDFGAMVSLTGVVTYANAPEVREAVRLAPIGRVMIETDAPFLSPEPKRKVRPCTPAFARITAEFVAGLYGVDWDRFHRQINENTERFFGVRSEVKA